MSLATAFAGFAFYRTDATGAGDVWVVGDTNGTPTTKTAILHWDGKTWTRAL